VHVERRRIAAQHVIVDGSDRDAVRDQLGHDRVDFGLEQDEIAHHHRAAVSRLECRPAAERQRRPDRDAVKRHLQVAARKSVAMNIAGDDRGGSPNRFVHLLPVDFLCADGARDGRQCANREYRNNTHVTSSCFGLLPRP
jgi:hypothetical protein